MVRDLPLKQKTREKNVDGKRWGDHGANPNGVYTGVRRVEWGKEEQRDGGGKPTKRET